MTAVMESQQQVHVGRGRRKTVTPSSDRETRHVAWLLVAGDPQSVLDTVGLTEAATTAERKEGHESSTHAILSACRRAYKCETPSAIGGLRDKST